MNNEIHIYNSLKNQIELFKPIKEGEIGIYVCGQQSIQVRIWAMQDLELFLM